MSHLSKILPISVAATLLLAACTTATGNPPSPNQPADPHAPAPGAVEAMPELDLELVAVGEGLYQANCASCHGADLAGDPNWKTPNPDGSYPPPPHDATGHTWHHPDQQLIDLVLNGSSFEASRMPAFAPNLDEEDVTAILEYLKSNWGPEERAFQWQVTQSRS